MTDLDRLLELEIILKQEQTYEFSSAMKLEKEYESLKAKIEGKIEDWESAKEWRNKWQNKMYEFEDLESQVAKLKEELETVNDKLGNELQVKYLEIEGLKEELVYLKELNNGLDYCAEQESIKSKQLKSTLDEIKAFMESDLDEEFVQSWHVRKELKEIIAKHEDKK